MGRIRKKVARNVPKKRIVVKKAAFDAVLEKLIRSKPVKRT
jgi:hypothetical protein